MLGGLRSHLLMRLLLLMSHPLLMHLLLLMRQLLMLVLHDMLFVIDGRFGLQISLVLLVLFFLN
jgi:hypothetical protein